MHHIRNAHLVTADEDFLGSVNISGKYMEDMHSGASGLAGDDWRGDYLLPGLVELHTDHLEKYLMPRPKVHWPSLSAVLAHDAQLAAAGVTTVLDAVALGDINLDAPRTELLNDSMNGLRAANQLALLRADHFFHLRLELGEPQLPQLLAEYVEDEDIRLVSLMDHTPGQRQWRDFKQYCQFSAGKYGWDERKAGQMLERLIQRQAEYVQKNREQVLAQCRARHQAQPLPLAAHDDSTLEHVEQSVADGITIAEFPTTLAAAQVAHQHGLKIVMGAPNRVRGGSHAGNVSAMTLARAGLLDILSSDYVPNSLLHGAWLLQEDGYNLPQAIATVSRNPAQAIGLQDRGELATGRRADFIRVRMANDTPIVLEVWKAGRRVV